MVLSPSEIEFLHIARNELYEWSSASTTLWRYIYVCTPIEVESSDALAMCHKIAPCEQAEALMSVQEALEYLGKVLNV